MHMYNLVCPVWGSENVYCSLFILSLHGVSECKLNAFMKIFCQTLKLDLAKSSVNAEALTVSACPGMYYEYF